MFFPYNTDAPIYHWPYVTVGLIVINVLVFCFGFSDPEQFLPFMLRIGDGIHPVQWLTTNFLHAGPMHLIGNMLFLWSFGLIVEGKLGPWKTLVTYLGIGIIYGAFVQTVMLWHEPTYCLGASGVISGFMVMCLLWAPENSMECVLLIYFRPFFFEMPVKILAGLFVGIDLLTLVLLRGELSTEFLHTVGAVLGLVAGIVLLKTNMVDCEHWDIFSVWAGRHTMTDVERAKMDAETPQAKQKKNEQKQKQRELLFAEFHRALISKNVVPALKIRDRIKKDFPGLALPESDLLALIQTLTEKDFLSEAVLAMREYLELYEAKAALVRLKLAKTLTDLDQPSAARKTLNQIDPQTLDARQMEFYAKLRRRIESASAQGGYELVE